MYQLEKPRANERREPLVFTLCKLELRSEAIVLQSRFSAMVNKGQNVRKKNILPQNKNKPRGKCCSMVSRRHLFRTMKNLTMKSNLGFVLGSWSLVTLLSSAFFAPSIFFLLTKWIGVKSVITVIECKQKMLSSWNRIFATKVTGSQWLVRITTPWRFINFY